MVKSKVRITFERYPGQPSGILKLGVGDSAFNDIPLAPGLYIMRDKLGKPLYIGKAKSLRKRIASYRRKVKDIKTSVVLAQTAYVEFIVTTSDAEALVLENNFIKEHHPRYNINLRDDKKYPYVKISAEPFPQIYPTRKLVSDGSVYLGPYVDAEALRQTLHLLKGIFKIRNCRQRFDRGKLKGPCLNFHMKLCMAPCKGGISEQDYARNVRFLRQFLSGGGRGYLRELKSAMNKASSAQDFERAGELRDMQAALERVLEEQKVEFGQGFEDFVGYAINRGYAVVVLLRMVAGKMIDRESYFLSASGEISADELLSRFLMDRYSRAARFPLFINLSQRIEYQKAIEEHISRTAERQVRLKIPQRGRKRNLVGLAMRNADLVLAEELARELERTSNQALLEIQQALSMPEPPGEIEAVDISHLGGVGSVGSLVHFRLGKPYKKSYRRYRIRGEKRRDDYAMVAEVVSRRIKRDEPMDLLLIDGGKGQLGSARQAIEQSGVDFGNRFLVALAKGDRDRLFTYRGGQILEPEIGERGLGLLARIRDEAHRFAHSYQVKTRQLAVSLLDDIPGVGKVKRQLLLKKFPGRNSIMSAGEQELAEIPGIGKKLAAAVFSHLHGKPR
jgi:excinuclease ABC subunit C